MALIVIVDDRVTNRNIFSRLAASIDQDIQVKAFCDPSEALVWLRDNPADLVITDYKMPQMNGADFIRAYRALPNASDTPVVVITVYEERSYRLRALEAGATDFLNSPVDHHEFVTRSRNLLALRRHQLMLARRAETLARELADSERSREREIRESRERLVQVIDALPVLVNAVDADGRVLFVNAFQTDFYERDPESCVGRPIAELIGEKNAATGATLDRLIFETGGAPPPYEEVRIDRYGEQRCFLTTKRPLRDHAGALEGVVSASLDITAGKRTEQHLRYLAHHDALTGLPNRALLAERARQAAARARRGAAPFALHLIDLDSFKAINDVRGHSAGDLFLKAMADRLGEMVREKDTLARLGGDEFAILQADAGARDDIAQFAARIGESIASFSEPDISALRTTASIGVAVYPADGEEFDELLRNADLAMYVAKGEGGADACFFSPDMQADARRQADLDAALRAAIEREEFLLFYQPQFCMRTGALVGVEALLRWRHPEKGLLGPGVFLPYAEQTGLIIPISDWALRAACVQAAEWQRQGLPPFRVAVNISAMQFRKRNVPLAVARLLGEMRLDPRRLELELTESIVVDKIDEVVGDMREISRLGAAMAIDDFGTGYSSLTYVKKLPVRRLKIDQSFVRNMALDANDAAIVRAIISMARSLGLETVAEGVETQEQMQRLREEGCDVAQGFHLGRPGPAELIAPLLRGAAALSA